MEKIGANFLLDVRYKGGDDAVIYHVYYHHVTENQLAFICDYILEHMRNVVDISITLDISGIGRGDLL